MNILFVLDMQKCSFNCRYFKGEITLWHKSLKDRAVLSELNRDFNLSINVG